MYENLQFTLHLMMKDCFLLKIENNKSISAVITFIQYSGRYFSQCNKTRRENKRYRVWKGEIKLLLFADDIVI